MRSFLLAVISAVLLTFLFWGPLWLGYGFVGGDLYPYFFPQKAFFSDRLHAGEFPLWNNLTGFGYPILGESQTGAAYPFHVLAYYVFDVNTAYNVEHLLHYMMCFVATWLFARRVGMSGSSPLLMALVFTYGWFPSRACLEWAIVTGAWMPVALWCVESFIQTRWWRYAIGLSFCLGLQMLAGHFHLAFITQMVVVAYGLWRLVGSDCDVSSVVSSTPFSGERSRSSENTFQSQTVTSTAAQPFSHNPQSSAESSSHSLSPKPERDGTKRRVVALIAALACAIVAGFLLAAVQLLPAWELKARSSRAVVGGEHEPSYGHLPPMYVSQLFAPFLWYSPLANSDETVMRDITEFAAPWHWFGPHHDLEAAVQQSRFGAIRAATNKIEAHLYCGLVPLGLAVWWAVVSLASKKEATVFRRETWFWTVAGLIALVYATGWLLPVARFLPGFNFFRGPGRYGIVTTWTVALLAGRGLNAFVNSRHEQTAAQQTTTRIKNGRDSQMNPSLGWGIPAIVCVVFASTFSDLWLVSRMVTNVEMVSSPAISFREASPIRKLLLNHPTRVRLYCPGQNAGNLLGVSCVPVYLGIAPTEYADARFAGKGMPSPSPEGQPTLAEDAFSKWLRDSGVTHILSFHRLDIASWKAESVWEGIDPLLHRTWGRSGSEPIYLYQLLDAPGPVQGLGLDITSIRPNQQRASNTDEFDVSSTSGGKFVVHDLNYPGWVPEIDGAAIPRDDDVSFRWMDVPSGKHHLRWTYRPHSVQTGGLISLATFFILAGLGHLRFWHRRRLDQFFARIGVFPKESARMQSE